MIFTTLMRDIREIGKIRSAREKMVPIEEPFASILSLVEPLFTNVKSAQALQAQIQTIKEQVTGFGKHALELQKKFPREGIGTARQCSKNRSISFYAALFIRLVFILLKIYVARWSPIVYYTIEEMLSNGNVSRPVVLAYLIMLLVGNRNYLFQRITILY